MSRDLPYYPWYVKDYNADARVRAMTDDQDLAYRRLLDASWELGSLPVEPSELAVIVRFTEKRFRRAWTFPLRDCWIENGNAEKPRLSNPRLERLRKHARSYQKSQSERGRKGGRPPKKKKTKAKLRNPGVIRGFSVDNPALSHPDPDPYLKNIAIPQGKADPDHDLSREEGEEEERADARRPSLVVQWNEPEETFDGDMETLKTELRRRYQEEFGKEWLNRTWAAIGDWCRDNPQKISAKKYHWRFILNWYRRAAVEEREKAES